MPIGKRWKNKRWQWCADYEDHSGKRVQRFFRTRDLAEEQFAKAVLASQQKTTPDLPTTITFAEYAAHWRGLQSHLKPATLECYDQQLRVHLLPAFGGTRVRDVQRGRLKAFLARSWMRARRTRYASCTPRCG